MPNMDAEPLANNLSHAILLCTCKYSWWHCLGYRLLFPSFWSVSFSFNVPARSWGAHSAEATGLEERFTREEVSSKFFLLPPSYLRLLLCSSISESSCWRTRRSDLVRNSGKHRRDGVRSISGGDACVSESHQPRTLPTFSICRYFCFIFLWKHKRHNLKERTAVRFRCGFFCVP